ncbi:putative TMhelix containing protein [Vibrio phage 424E50-1]|nr:putative TMhelix containing protein [Vibrio phage 501E54-1]CAH9015114.1 putative TMhelix containing protein [Vibrio phage 424E50-1]
MIPYLLPIVLLMYGEFSKDIHTRFIARVLFYSYAMSYILAGQIPLDNNQEILFNSGILCLGLSYAVVRCRNLISRIPFMLALFGVTLNTISLYLGDFRIIEILPYYANNSHYLIRECILFGIGSFGLWKRVGLERDYTLACITFWVWCIETVTV